MTEGLPRLSEYQRALEINMEIKMIENPVVNN